MSPDSQESFVTQPKTADQKAGGPAESPAGDDEPPSSGAHSGAPSSSHSLASPSSSSSESSPPDASTFSRDSSASPPPKPPFRLRGNFLTCLILTLVLGCGLWYALRNKEPQIAPNSPAAQLLRNDADKQAKAQAALEAAKADAANAAKTSANGTAPAGQAQNKEPKLYLKARVEQESIDSDAMRIRFELVLDSEQCKYHNGESTGRDTCEELAKNLSFSGFSLRTDPPLPEAVVSINKNEYIYYTVARGLLTIPLENLPEAASVKLLPFELPAARNTSIAYERMDVRLPEFSLSTKLSSIFADPERPERLIVQGSITSTLPMDRASLEQNTTIAFAKALPDANSAEAGHAPAPASASGSASVPSSASNAGAAAPGAAHSSETARGELGAPVIVWANNRECTVTIPLLSLPLDSDALVLHVKEGVRRLKGNGVTALASRAVREIPTAQNIAGVKDITLLVPESDDAIVRPAMQVDFSLPVKRDEAQKAVSARLLPLYATAREEKEKTPTNWIAMDTIPEKVLRSAPVVSLTPSRGEGDYTDHLDFSHKAPSNRYLHVTVNEGLHSRGGYVTPLHQTILKTPEPEASLRFMQEGHILSLNGARKLALASRGLDSIEWTAHRVRGDYLNLLAGKSSSFTEPSITGYSIDLEDISDVLEGAISLGADDGLSPQYSSLDLGKLMEQGARGIFQLNLKGKRNTDEICETSRFILVTDLALMVMQGVSGERTVFVSSFSKGGPAAGAEIRVIARNGLALAVRTTDAAGRAELPALDGFTREKAPVAIEVRKGNDVTYMLMSDYNTLVGSSEWSKEKSEPSGLSIFVFSERGMYRPGETLRFGLLVKDADWNAKAGANLPVTLKLRDPQGDEIAAKTVRTNAVGLAETQFPTAESAPTGRYYVRAYLGDNMTNNEAGDSKDRMLGSESVQVEEFQPDRIKVTTRLLGVQAGNVAKTEPPSSGGGDALPAPANGWLRPESLQGDVSVENFYGAPVEGGQVKARFTAQRVSEDFVRYKDYSFSSPRVEDASRYEEGELTEQTTDAQGKAFFTLPTAKLEEATYVVRLTAEGFEKGGGRSVVRSARAIISPFDAFIGWRSNAKLEFLAKDAPAAVDFVALGRAGITVDSGPVSLSIRRVEYATVLVKADSRYRYEQQRQTVEVEHKTLSIPPDGLTVNLPTNTTGEHELVMKNAKGVVLTALNFTVAGGSNRHQGLKRDATVRIRLDKKEYKAGESVQVFISAPYPASGLLTLEGEKVLNHAWFNAATTDSVQTITVPAGYEGRAFLNVHLLRHQNTDDPAAPYMSPSTHAVEPLIVNMDRRNMGLTLSTLDKALPGDRLNIGISAQKPGKAIVFAVDEGILQLTNFQTPSPKQYFLLDKSHEVNTWGNWSLLMPEYGLVQKESAFGGDLSRELLSRMNPFRRKHEPSVVFWSGVLDVGPQVKTLTWDVPGYFNGRVRVMAIGASEDAVGETQSKVIAKAPLIITPTLPLAVAPGDSFEVTVSLVNNVDNSGQGAPVSLRVDLPDSLVYEQEPPASIPVDQGKEGRITFRVKASDTLGEATIGLTASVGRDKDAQSIRRPVSLSIRPASPRISAFAAGRLTEGEQVIPVARDMFPQFASVQASVSGLPLPIIDGLTAFLREFPHGCTEQVLSTAFPYPLLRGNADLLPQSRDKAASLKLEADRAVSRALLTLKERRVKPGRYALWPQQDANYTFLTVYSLDFMLTAKEGGYSVAPSLLDETLRETKTLLRTLPATLNDLRMIAYGAWVYNRAGLQGLGDRFKDISGLIKHADAALPGWRKDVSAVFLAGAYKILQQDKEAEALLKEAVFADDSGPTPWQGDGWFLSPLWANGAHLAILARHFPERLRDNTGQELLIRVINDVGAGRYTTTGAVQAIRGIVSCAASAMPEGNTAATGKEQTGGGISTGASAAASVPSALQLVARDAAHKELDGKASGTLIKRLQTDSRTAEFLFAGGKGLYWQIRSSGFDRLLAPGSVASSIAVSTEFLHADKGKTLAQLRQGEDIYVLVRAKTTGKTAVDNVAITALIPGGFEMIVDGEVRGALSENDNSKEPAPAAETKDGTAETPGGDSSGPDKAVLVSEPNRNLTDDARAMLREAGINDPVLPVTHADRREDRMVLFTRLDNTERAYIFRIKAVNKGRFTLPVTFAEALYNPDARARTGLGFIEVK